MKSYRGGVSPSLSMTGILTRIGEEANRMIACDTGSRNWNDTSINQGMSRIVSKHQKTEELRKDSLPEVSERACPC